MVFEAFVPQVRLPRRFRLTGIMEAKPFESWNPEEAVWFGVNCQIQAQIRNGESLFFES